jgi:nitrate reductase gamma subunit
VEALLEFARGPLFRLTFAVLVLGLARLLLLDLAGMIEAYRKAGDKQIPWRATIRKTLAWLVPVERVWQRRPIYSVTSILFHIGLLVTPIFLFAHVQLWEQSIGIGWWTLSPEVADWLTIATIAFGLGLLLGRVGTQRARAISRVQDYFWPVLLIIPFITGWLCANVMLAPQLYRLLMLGHLLSAELIFVLIPFTKIAHCILMPFSQAVSVLAWKFPARVDDDVCTTLNKKGAPV